MTHLQAECHESSEEISLMEVSSFTPQLLNDLIFINMQLKFTWAADNDADKEEDKEPADANWSINAVRMENAGLYIDRNALLCTEYIPSVMKIVFMSFFGIPRKHLTAVMDKILSCGRRLAGRRNPPYIICMKLKLHCHLDSSAAVDAVKDAFSKILLHRELTSIKIQDNVVVDDVVEVEERARPTSCVICLEEIAAGSLATGMACLHFFHHRCISEWLAKSSTCPLCRHPGKRMHVSLDNELIAYLG